jgi:hypothetical protein
MSSPHGFEVIDTSRAARSLDGYPRVVLYATGVPTRSTIDHVGQQLTQSSPRLVQLSLVVLAYFAITHVACAVRATRTATTSAISVGPGATTNDLSVINPVVQTWASGDPVPNDLTVTPFGPSMRSTTGSP